MHEKLEMIWKEAVVSWSRYYPGIFLEGLNKTTKILNQDNECAARAEHLPNTSLELCL
jgi:hypothetical protein